MPDIERESAFLGLFSGALCPRVRLSSFALWHSVLGLFFPRFFMFWIRRIFIFALLVAGVSGAIYVQSETFSKKWCTFVVQQFEQS